MELVEKKPKTTLSVNKQDNKSSCAPSFGNRPVSRFVASCNPRMVESHKLAT